MCVFLFHQILESCFSVIIKPFLLFKCVADTYVVINIFLVMRVVYLRNTRVYIFANKTEYFVRPSSVIFFSSYQSDFRSVLRPTRLTSGISMIASFETNRTHPRAVQARTFFLLPLFLFPFFLLRSLVFLQQRFAIIVTIFQILCVFLVWRA